MRAGNGGPFATGFEIDPTLFATERAVEGTWRVLDEILGPVGRAHRYTRGSMGPGAADALTREHGGWTQPLGVARDRPA